MIRMRHIRMLTVLILCLLTLAGCACQHQWTEAACLTPKTCTLCEETEGEPAGHIWMEATCEAPKTCSVCSVTEGQPLAHSEAVRDCAIDYKTLTMERQTYCVDCSQILSSEEILLDTLHDGTHFLLDGKGFLERYTVIDEPFQLMSVVFDAGFTVVELKEETAEDILVLECYDQYGYTLRVRFTFCDVVKGNGEAAVPRCARIIVDPAVSGELGEPDPGGLLDPAQPDEADEVNRLRELAHAVSINDLMFRNLMLGFMVLDPSLETDTPTIDAWRVLLDIMDVIEGENPGFVLNGIHYYSNENGELVIEPAE